MKWLVYITVGIIVGTVVAVVINRPPTEAQTIQDSR
ncbi:hypothetical protein HYPP_02500 [Hyphomicrobium sp. ghe19]|nr:hypothetical protein HYPP_02500 [Hyphomicrobium sp. ghe19]